MPKVGVVIDNWKLPIFERHLKQACHTYKWTPGLTPDTGFITVEIERHTEAASLHQIVKAANTEAAQTGAPKK